MKRIVIGIFVCLLFTSCNQEQMENLNAQLEKQKTEIAELKQENQKLRSDFKRVEAAGGNLVKLSKKLKDIKARLVTSMGDIELKFFPDKAPIHVFNFLARAESGYYDGVQFHRVMKGFMIQGGDPNSKDDDPKDDGMGGPFVKIPHEFNNVQHKRGILSTARPPNVTMGAGSQFFIMHGDSPHLDGQYTAFGEVTKGMDVVDDIANVPKMKTNDPNLRNHPIKPVRIRRVEIYRYGDGRQ